MTPNPVLSSWIYFTGSLTATKKPALKRELSHLDYFGIKWSLRGGCSGACHSFLASPLHLDWFLRRFT